LSPLGLGLVLLLGAAGLAASPQAPPAAPPLDRPALLIIDIQNFYFEGGRIPLVGSDQAALKAGVVLSAFREKGWPVFHIQHLPMDAPSYIPGTTDSQYAIREAVKPAPGEPVVAKHFANSFRDTDLAAKLKAAGIKTLVVAGMQTHMCVEAAVRHAADAGYVVVLVEDACATRDLKRGETVVPAGHVQAAVLAALDGAYARIVTAKALLASLQ
jgi:nicotinamidase-related amidase